MLQRTYDLATAVAPERLFLSLSSQDGGAPRAAISFVVDEALGQEPTVTVGESAAALVQQDRFSYRYAYEPTGGEPQDVPTPVIAQVQDVKGNGATLELGSIVFDFEPPRAFDPEKVTYGRNPPAEDCWVRGDDGAFAAGHHVRIYADGGTAGFDGEGATSPSGALAKTSAPESQSTVYVSQVDRAGNEGPKTEVKRVELEATFARKTTTWAFLATPGSGMAQPG